MSVDIVPRDLPDSLVQRLEELAASHHRSLQGEIIALLEGVLESRWREIRIRNFRSDRLDLVDDLVVVLEERGGQYIANSYDTGQYGYGPSPDDAIQHLCSVIEDYYDLLVEDEGRLSQPLQAHLRYLRSVLRERG